MISRVCGLCFKSLYPASRTSAIPKLICVRGHKRWVPPTQAALYQRRLVAGPEPERHRSEWINWNYNAEIYAFGKRLNEEFEESTLRKALTHRSYIEKEEKKRAELGIDTAVAPLGLEDNEQLAQSGEELMSRFVKAYLRHVYPRLYEEGICAIHDHLMSEKVLAHTASHIGIGDIVLCEDFPVRRSTLVETFKAVVGALKQDQGEDRAMGFVLDFVIPRLLETDINQLWVVSNPMGLLSDILSQQGRSPPEPRLQWQSASQTIMSLYYVGIYSDKQLLGQSPGETITIAEEMAARDALEKIMGTADNRAPLKLGPRAKDLSLDFNRINPSVADVAS